MMKPVSSLFIATLAAAFGLAGCSSPAGPRGDVHVGDTPESVHDAMGEPAGKQDVPNTGGHQSIWIYTNIHQERSQPTGWSEVFVPAVHDQNNKVVQEAVTHDVYRTQVKEDIHVVFTDGLVSSIEHLKR